MFHFIYKITNQKNGKIYVGIHSTDRLNDGYLGSGPYILKAIEKYGSKNFHREILKFFYSREAASAEEARIVDQEFVNRRDNYNMTVGGGNGPVMYGEKNPNYGKKISVERREFLRQKAIQQFKENGHPFLGKKHKESTKRKIGELAAQRTHSEEVRKKISKAGKGKKMPKELVERLTQQKRDNSPIYLEENLNELKRLWEANKTGAEIEEYFKAKGLISPEGGHYSFITLMKICRRRKWKRFTKLQHSFEQMSLVFFLREEGLSFKEIALELASVGIVTRTGKPYSTAGVATAFHRNLTEETKSKMGGALTTDMIAKIDEYLREKLEEESIFSEGNFSKLQKLYESNRTGEEMAEYFRNAGVRTREGGAYSAGTLLRICRKNNWGKHQPLGSEDFINQIFFLRESGLNLQEIADELAVRGVLTRTGEPYTAGAVSQACRRHLKKRVNQQLIKEDDSRETI